jgi:hypothetical protein
MSLDNAPILDDLQQLKQQLEEFRSTNPPRSRLPESIWAAAAEAARRHGLHLTSKALRMDYAGLKKRLRPATQIAPASPAFLELLATSTECVVELESNGSRMRVALKGIPLDWAGLLSAWRATES